jgi:DNA ligase (NAD+)
LHNADQIEKLDIRVGDTVLSKKEEIIPKIIAVDLTKRNKDSEYLSNCPECETTLVRNEGEANHCTNFYGCPRKL